MKTPIFVSSFFKEESEALQTGLREYVPRIARSLGCGQQTVRDAIHDFNERGLDALVAKSPRPKRTGDDFDEEGAEALKEMLHRSPREFGYDTSLWTLAMAAEVARTGSPAGGSRGRPSGRRFRGYLGFEG